MTLKLKHLIYLIFCALVVGIVMVHRVHVVHQEQAIQAAREARMETRRVQKRVAKTDNDDMRKPINWKKSSQTSAYPDLNAAKHLWIKVNLRGNRTYVYDGKKRIYTMYSTGGLYQLDEKSGKEKSLTPTGTFHIQSQRGDKFYNANLNEGANYYVSWLNHGTYLFHSVPTEKNGKYNQKEAAKLGKTQGSHGCIRLSVPDAKWLSTTVPVGTKVVISDD